jgi:hypothetical protein
VPDQEYCCAEDCQRARKRKWQKEKLVSDPDYRAAQKEAQERWIEKNPGYWKQYRKEHNPYTERNRDQQRERSRANRAHNPSDYDPCEVSGVIAKMDASSVKNSVSKGRYLLVPVIDGKFAKMDASLVEIIGIMGSYPSIGDICKERT